MIDLDTLADKLEAALTEVRWLGSPVPALEEAVQLVQEARA